MTDVHDPYGGCEDTCSHDLARGALTVEVLNEDGPYPDKHPLLDFDSTLQRWIRRRLADSQAQI